MTRFAVDDKGRTLTLAVALAAVALVVGSAVAGLAGLGAGYVLAPIWALIAVEAGRVAWTTRAELVVDGDSFTVETPLGSGGAPLGEISWFGLTARGLVIETATDRFVLFDQFAALSADAASTLGGVVDRTFPPPVVSHDAGRRVVGSVAAALFGVANLTVAGAAIAADVDALERATALVLSLVSAGAGIYLLHRWAVRPYRVRFDGNRMVTQSLLWPDRTLEGVSVATGRDQTVLQRLTNSPAGEYVVVAHGDRTWRGPVAAPGSFEW
ncbi:MAG: hypothetical protein R2770_12890 [Acidimicrobiales bacterium]